MTVASPRLDDARALLRASFGHPDFRPGQERAVSSVLAGQDTVVILPTGGGKSICYQVPALLLPGITLVVSPLISLMKDQVDSLAARGVPATCINSTLRASEVADRLARVERGDIRILYVAPERFDVGSVGDRLRAAGVSLLAVDEAHCISDWGHDFRPSYLRIRAVRERLGAPPVVALTATATPEVRADIVRQLALRDPTLVITGFDRENLRYHVVPTRTERDKDDAVTAQLRAHPGQAIIYAATRRSVDRIAGVLTSGGIDAAGYHAGLDDARRHDVQNAFMREEVRAIVATNAFGMGIDKPNVRLVVHQAMPGSLAAYYQEAGRAGRDGLPSDCVLLHAFQDRFTHEFFIRSGYPDRQLVGRVYEALKRRADETGLARTDAAGLTSLIGGGVREREVESALRILAQGGAVLDEPANASRIYVRLLATPERIRRELDGAEMVAERELLRALWRAVGARLQRGATVDPDGLPPGFGGLGGVSTLLDRLQARQFVLWERTGGGIRLLAPAAPLSAHAIDWAQIEHHRAADTAQLDAVQHYAYTTGCRRRFILRYFGDPAARPRCDGCDNCLGTHRAAVRDGDGGRRTRRGVAPAAAPAAPDSLSDTDHALADALRALRREIARDERLPAYCIFPDRTLVEMAVRRPRSLADLAGVRGVGPARLDRYGAQFLAAIRDANDTEAA